MRPRRAGFTLIEALVAIVISTAAVAIGSASLAAALRMNSNLMRHARAESRAGSLREELGIWLTSAHTVGDSAYRFVLSDKDGDGYGDELTFASLNAEPITRALSTIVLRWQATNGNESLYATLTPVSDADPHTQNVSLSRWVSSLKIRVKPDVISDWTGQWSSAVLLPIAIEVQMDTSCPDSLAKSVRKPLVVLLHSSQ